jgi:hypothetical protein
VLFEATFFPFRMVRVVVCLVERSGGACIQTFCWFSFAAFIYFWYLHTFVGAHKLRSLSMEMAEWYEVRGMTLNGSTSSGRGGG